MVERLVHFIGQILKLIGRNSGFIDHFCEYISARFVNISATCSLISPTCKKLLQFYVLAVSVSGPLEKKRPPKESLTANIGHFDFLSIRHCFRCPFI